jgi:hypothetical protein
VSVLWVYYNISIPHFFPFLFFLFFFVALGFELRTCIFCHSTNPFICDGCFQDRVSRTICLRWFWTVILPISDSWVARFIHQHLDHFFFFCFLYYLFGFFP